MRWQFYNNMAAPNNCVGGSETSCPATDPVPPPPPAHWYANGENHVSIADGQQLRGAEFYNNAGAPGNCVGGSEQGCSPPGMPEPRGAGSSVFASTPLWLIFSFTMLFLVRQSGLT